MGAAPSGGGHDAPSRGGRGRGRHGASHRRTRRGRDDDRGLPLAGCSFDYKASNLVFAPAPTLVDPDHAARMPRLYDLAIALLLFHCDLPTAPPRVWTGEEWGWFLDGYREQLDPTAHEIASWRAVLELAWLDQAVWLLGNWPEGWADAKDRLYLLDLATIDLDRFALA